MAEKGGFEPPVQCYLYNGLANRRLQPLGHLSNHVIELLLFNGEKPPVRDTIPIEPKAVKS